MKNFDWDAFSRDEIAVWCKTEEEAKDFCKQSYEHGYNWCSGESRFNKTEYYHYEGNTTYSSDGYSDVNWFEDNGYIVVEWSDYMSKPFTKSDLKDGDMVLRRNGAIEVAIPSAKVFTSVEGFNSLCNIDENLKSCWPSSSLEWDIMEVRRPTAPSDCQSCCFRREWGTLMFKREKLVEMTLEEVCKALGKTVKIVDKKED